MSEALKVFFLALPDKLREEDKVKHMVWSFLLTLTGLLVWSVPVTFAGVFLLGLAKECWDFRYGSGFCLFDMMGNLVGSVAGLILVGIISFVL